MKKNGYEQVKNGHMCDKIISYCFYRSIRYSRHDGAWLLTFGSYMHEGGDGVQASVPIDYCPYCGEKLPDVKGLE